MFSKTRLERPSPPVIAFVTDELPRPGAAGHLALNHAIINWLRQEGFAVTILLTGSRLSWPVQRYTEARVMGPHIARLGPYLGALSPSTALGIGLRALLRRLPPVLATRLRRARYNADAVLGGFPTPSDLRWCARAVERLQPQAVLIDTVFRAPLLAEPELAGINSVVITHDVFHRRAQALSAAGYRVLPENFSRIREAKLLGRASSIAAIQPEEALILRAMCPARNIFTAPMPALPYPPPPEMARIPGRLVFVGSDSLPNLDGLRWFFAEIWPQFLSKGLTLDLVGDCGLALSRLPRGVKALGRVSTLAPLLHRASLAISPLRTGSGLKIKLLDYARHGLHTIATPPSLQGFYLDAASPFIMAGSANIFARAVLRHAAMPRQPDAALAYVTLHYGVEASFAGLRDALAPGQVAASQDDLRALKL